MTPRPNISPSDWTAIARYVSGEATADERAELDARATRDAAFAQLLSESFTGWTSAGTAPHHRDVDAAWMQVQRQVSGRVVGRIETSITEHRRTPAATGYGRWYAATAVVLGVLLIGIGGTQYTRTHRAGNSVATSAYVTADGERANITLPDGATVALNVGSRLDVPADYATGNHTVHLVGEALFSVERHDGVPFTVVAGGVQARVLGTSFVVRHYNTDSTATVAVREGKVAVGSTVVTASRMVEIGPQGAIRREAADSAQFAFAVGALQLTRMPLVQAIPELNRWYSADIRLGDSSFAQIPLKGTFAAGSLSDLTAMLEFMLDARVVRNGRVLTLYRKG